MAGKSISICWRGILGYFALAARRTPPERINLYLGLFFLGGVTDVMGDVIPLLPHPLYYLYYVFQPNVDRFSSYVLRDPTPKQTRLRRHPADVPGRFLVHAGPVWHPGDVSLPQAVALDDFRLFLCLGTVGGFRGYIISCGLLFAIQFFLEGLYKTRLMAIFTIAGVLGALALVPLAEHLPYTFQRAMSFLPYKVSNAARMDAQASWDWRVNMWKGLLPQIPQYLLLGKGYNISPLDYDFVMGPEAAVHSAFAKTTHWPWRRIFIAGRFPPSSRLASGAAWPCFGFWQPASGRFTATIVTAIRPCKGLIRFFLAAFVGETIFFLFGFGDLASDMMKFTGLLGLSVSY